MVSKSDLAEYSLFMHVLADAADAIARQYYGQPVEQQLKADQSPVTIADQEIEMALIEKIRTHYPDHGIFGEENSRILPEAEWQWVIDPIDGTRAFIAGKTTFTALIALCPHQIPLLGLISQPIKKERWLGGDGQPIERDSEDEPAQTLADAHLATTSVPYFSAPQAAAFKRLEQACVTTVLNQDAYAYAMLAEGKLDVVVDAALKPYDFCALVPVVEKAGGVISDWSGRPVTMQSDGHILAAANKTLHKAALDLLNKCS